MRKYLLLLIALFAINGYSQNKVLNLHFSGKDKDIEVTLRYSILGLLNYAYEPYMHKANTKEGYLSITIPDSITSFLMNIDTEENYKWGKNINLYMGNADSLDIYLDPAQNPIFKGHNSDLYEFMFMIKNGTGNERIKTTLNDYLNSNKYNSFFDFIEDNINLNLAILDSIYYNNKDIDEYFYNYAKEIVIDDFLFRAGNIASLTDQDFLSKSDSISFFYDVDRLYNTYNTNIIDGISLDRKAALKGMSLIPKTEFDLGIDYDFKPFIYLNNEEQEKAAASEIITLTSINKLDSITLTNKVRSFKKAFPNSKYNHILDILEVVEKKDFLLANFSLKDGFNEYGVLQSNNLSKLTSMFMNNQYILVDFWATWCAPCLKEFKENEELDNFIKENNIGILYVSLDFGGNYDKWKETIISKKLDGLHYLATPDLAAKFSYFKESTSIPRYVLLNRDGSVLIDNCELPSSGKLINQIEKALNN